MQSKEYYIDLQTFRLEKLKNRLKNFRLLPSQQILRERIDERFALLSRKGIENVHQLQGALKTKSKVQSFSEETGIPVEYLTILRREVNSYQPKPINLKDFPGVNLEFTRVLDKVGIKNTFQLFPHIISREGRNGFAKMNGIDDEELLELTKLTDVARLKYVGPKFARLLIATDFDTVEKIAKSRAAELYDALMRANAECGIYKGKFGIDDMDSWIKIVVQEVPQVIEY
jgi:hypothetical protein